MFTRRSASTVAIAVSAVALAAGLALTSSRASAMIEVPGNTDGYLSVYTDFYPLHFTDMAPGEEAFARLDVLLSDSPTGELSLEVRKSGELATMPGGLAMEIQHCDVPWTNVPLTVTQGVTPLCSTGATTVLNVDESSNYTVDSPEFDVDGLQIDTLDHLLARMSIPATTSLASVEGRSAEFSFNLTASGLADPAALTPPANLAFTGFDTLYLALVAAGAIGIGVAVRMRRQSAQPVAARPDHTEVTE